MYKLRRVVPWFPEVFEKIFRKGILRKLSLYVPTNDIAYVVVQKKYVTSDFVFERII